MCARFELNASRDLIAHIFDDDPPPPEMAMGELRPTNRVAARGMDHHWRMLNWGIPAPWDGKPLINARAETLESKPTFRPYLDGRLVIPATAYFEWRKTPSGKLKNRIGRANFAPFGLAAVGDEACFTIITCPPAPAIAHIHDRMPVMLNEDAIAAWLAGAPAETVLVPFPDPMEAREDAPRQADLFG